RQCPALRRGGREPVLHPSPALAAAQELLDHVPGDLAAEPAPRQVELMVRVWDLDQLVGHPRGGEPVGESPGVRGGLEDVAAALDEQRPRRPAATSPRRAAAAPSPTAGTPAGSRPSRPPAR